MAKIGFERHVTRFEIQNQCFLLEDDKGDDHQISFKSNDLLLHSHGKTYPASVREFYVNGKFKNGIFFPHEEGHVSEFHFDLSVAEGKRMKINVDTDADLVDGKMPVDIDVYIVTKQ